MTHDNSTEVNKGLEAYVNNAKRLGFAYGSLGLVLGGTAAYFANRYNASFRQLQMGPKTFLVSSCGLVGFVLGSEQAAFITPGSAHFQKDQAAETKPFTTWFEDNKFKIVGGVWVGTMLGTMAYLATQKHMKMSEKLIHGRIVAQGTTLAAIGATALVSACHFGDTSEQSTLVSAEKLRHK